jgi:hypothetical protein
MRAKVRSRVRATDRQTDRVKVTGLAWQGYRMRMEIGEG